jgi:hypothetical protein
MMAPTTHLNGIPDQAIAACDRIERGLHDAIDRAQRACQEASRELKHMLDLINADRAARGVSPLDLTVPGIGAGRGDYELYRQQASRYDQTDMQWQTIRDARAKDKWERQVCAR